MIQKEILQPCFEARKDGLFPVDIQEKKKKKTKKEAE